MTDQHISPDSFHASVDEALGGADLAAGVPCSLLGPWLQELDSLVPQHIRSTNEGEAVAVATGSRLAGKRPAVYLQNSGLGNAVNPLTSLAAPFGVPLLLVVGYRGRPGSADEPQHRLMGAATTGVLDAIGIEHAVVEDHTSLQLAAGKAARAIREGRSHAWLVPKGVFAKQREEVSASTLPNRREFIELLAKIRVEHSLSVIATTGMSGRELESICPRDEDLYMVGSMGCAPSLALGVSLGAPTNRLVVLDGDGALLMRLESMVALARYATVPITHIVVDNGSYDSTGAQATLSGEVDFEALAKAAGYRSAATADSLATADALLRRSFALTTPGPHLCVLKARPGDVVPVGRPRLEPREQGARFTAAVIGG
ncbi:phosphonopyruvate decarboxylase [Amycolatopsis sp. NPDC005003]